MTRAQLHKPKPLTCPACHLRPRSKQQQFCRTCTRSSKVVLSTPEFAAARDLTRFALGMGRHASQFLPLTAACERLAQGKQPSTEDRLAIGALTWSIVQLLEARHYQDIRLETLYRRLMLHDIRTMKPQPFPPIKQPHLTAVGASE